MATYNVIMKQYNGSSYDTILVKPSAHASTHASNGNDPITPSSIGAATSAQGSRADSAVRSVVEGTTNGTVSVNTGGTTANVKVHGLGSAAYTASTTYATSSQGTKADNAMPKSGGSFSGAVTFSGNATFNNQIILSANDYGTTTSGQTPTAGRLFFVKV